MTQVGISHSELDEIDQISDVTQKKGDLNPCIFLCVGNLIHLKAVHLAIQALGHAKLQNARLWIAGSGQEDKRLKVLTKKLKLSHQVEFLGQVDRSKVMQLMQDSTCLVHASLHDSGGFVVVEAMANSRPVICLKLAGPDVVVAENAGLKVEANDESATIMALAKAMIQIASNPAAAITMGKNGRRHVEHNLLWRNKAEKINSIYRSLAFESETRI
jgi:glycosyltransferase involved in cell wall biosynthesis